MLRPFQVYSMFSVPKVIGFEAYTCTKKMYMNTSCFKIHSLGFYICFVLPFVPKTGIFICLFMSQNEENNDKFY